MMTLAKSTALLFLVACVVSTVAGQTQEGTKTPVAGQTQEETKIPVAQAVPMQVNHNARVAVPILYKSLDYHGPYDPFDPKGISAAIHRNMKIAQHKAGEVVKSYIPPGMGKFCKHQLIGLAVSEGKRFAVGHPRETAELMVLAGKAKALYQNAQRAMKKKEEAEQGGHGHNKH